MIGAISEDIVGSVYEARPIKTVDFPLFGSGSNFTHDTLVTVAAASAILSGKRHSKLGFARGRRRHHGPCIAGGIAHAYYGEVPGWIEAQVRAGLSSVSTAVMDGVSERFCPNRSGARG